MSEENNQVNNVENNQANVSDEYRPIGAWGYVGYQILFAITLVGFIVALVFALGGVQNKNVKNYARAYFCWMLLAIIVMGVAVVIGVVGGVAFFNTANMSIY